MKNIDEIIDPSALPPAVKGQLKQFAQDLLACRLQAFTIAQEISVKKANINERQFSERLNKATSDKERENLLKNQIAYRECFTNTVLRSYENSRQIIRLCHSIRGALRAFGQAQDDATLTAQVALIAISDCDEAEPTEILKHLDNVSGISKERLTESDRMIFRQRVRGVGPYAKVFFNAQPINVFDPSPEQAALVAASRAAIKSFDAYRENASDFVKIKSRLNRPQFTERMEAALTEGDMTKFERIKREQKNVEAELFVASRMMQGTLDRFKADADRYGEVIDRAAAAVKDDGSLQSLIFMSNCNAAWHWLGEMHYLIDCSNLQDISALLSDLDIDVAAVLAA